MEMVTRLLPRGGIPGNFAAGSVEARRQYRRAIIGTLERGFEVVTASDDAAQRLRLMQSVIA